ncbi:aldehyde dehydrogenase family protein [Caballeronia sp. 15711]|uniref:aldehyde dehydrogenase family protein n=1 Tax=Caballeronia sp. 15711 TaxID=3391029 RepID=UPI0039E2DDC9
MEINATGVLLSNAAQEFLNRPKKLLINGRFVDSVGGETLPVYDPGTASVIGHIPASTREDVNRAVAAARDAFDNGPWRRTTAAVRQKLIWMLADRIESHLDEFAELEALDTGKPLAEARAIDIPYSVEQFRYMAGWATKISGSTLDISAPGNYHAYTLREPVGVVAQIVPWNFPMLLAAYKLAPALAAGCTLILKPAEQTSLTALRLAELFQEVGFPPGVVNVVTGLGHVVGAALAEHPDVDKVAFTGSTEVGKQIVRASAGNLKKVTVELGGKSPVIVFPDADLDKAVPGIAAGIFLNQGQVCTAGSRVYAHRKIYDKLVAGIVERANTLKLGHALASGTEMGPLVSDEQINRVQGFVDAAVSEGVTVAAGGKRVDRNGYFMQPTVFCDTSDEMSIARDEIFGPVLCVMPFDDDGLDVVARRANASQYGLAASVWTENVSTAHLMAKQLRSGIVWLNCHNYFDPAFPVGGFKQSGWGRECGPEAISLYTELKSVLTAL